MTASIRCVSAGGASVTVELASALTPALRDRARGDTNRWIKSLRHARYGSASMRERFTYRDDSLWWFTELYLQKMRRLDTAVAAVLALDAIHAAQAPARVEVTTRDGAIREAALAFGRARGVAVSLAASDAARSRHGWPGFLVGLTAELARLRPARPARVARRPRVAAFIHTAFWRGGDGDEGAAQEHYLGPVLDAIASRTGAGGLAYVGLGPRRNFRARRWWDPVTAGAAARAVTPIEQFAPRRAVAGALDLWRRRAALADAVATGDGIRAAAAVHGCDLWPVLAHELRGAALVQWPWSARAMDEAGAAIDALDPETVVTYAEAGGWGRALVLEARRRGVPSIGVQHGFIYRHWLNYLHAADEHAAIGGDRGVPIPTRSLLFDRYAAEHLIREGAFPEAAISVTGSPRLDELAAKMRTAQSAAPGMRIVLAAKHSEIAGELPGLFAAVGARPDVRLVIKPHPAETPDVYAPLARSHANIAVAPASADLAALLSGAAALVTMNSTVAIDGLVLGVPALVVGLPNNLSPFVDAGVMVGVDAGGAIGPQLQALLYDRQVRDGLLARAAGFAARYEMRADGQAASRAADEVLAMTRTQ